MLSSLPRNAFNQAPVDLIKQKQTQHNMNLVNMPNFNIYISLYNSLDHITRIKQKQMHR